MSKDEQINLIETWEKSALVGILVVLEDCDPSDDEVFAKAIDMAVSHGNISVPSIARTFELDRSTVNRWASGKTKPHQMVRPLILDWIKDRLGEQVSHLHSDTQTMNTLTRKTAQRLEVA